MHWLDVDGKKLPGIFYGTAWKEDRTAQLTLQALTAGFRAIDTANQRKHYHEAGVGAGLKKMYECGALKRSDVFLQTKFTYQGGQDHRLPYDPSAPLSLQVQQSFQSSLEHLGADTLDSYVLHGPAGDSVIDADDREVWRAMEVLQSTGKTRYLGVSNVNLRQLREICEFAAIKPKFVQNRCYARTFWDRETRAFCRDQGILYQGFSLLTANSRELAKADINSLVAEHGCTLPQLIFAWAASVDMLVLTGTTSETHMREDLAADRFQLSDRDRRTIEEIITAH